MREGRDADPQVLADRALVEGVGLAGQLDLAVQRLVGDAEQGPVGHPEAVALGGDGADSMSMATARLWLKRKRRRTEAKLPVAVVGGDHGAGPQALLQLSCGSSPVTSAAASYSASWTSAIGGIGISTGSTSSSTWSSRR